jgi:hypothetical protein
LQKDRSKSSILLGGAVDRYSAPSLSSRCRSGILDNVKRKRDAIFDESDVEANIKEIIVELLAEPKAASNKQQ